jgi:Flp pilus assembly protein TadG
MWGVLKRLFTAESGSIMVLAAFALTAVMGMSGLAVEVGNGYYAKVRNQRVADMAALGAAMAYQSTSSVSQSTQVARDIVAANGLPGNAAAVTLPISVGSISAVKVQITSVVPIRLATMITKAASYSVSATAVASIGGNATLGCVMALDKTATNGVLIDGASGLDATGCAVLSNAAVTLNGSGTLKASSIVSGGNITKPQWSGTIVGTQQPNTANAAVDPLANNSALAAAFAQLGQVVGPTAPVMPGGPAFSGSGTDWTFQSSASAFNALPNSDPTKKYCALAASQYTCSAGTYAINNLAIPGNMKVTFQGPSQITVYGTVSDGGAGLSFVGGTNASISFKNGYSSNSSGVSFGNMDVYFGGNVTLNGTSSIGNGTVTVQGSFSTGGSSTVTIGAGAHAFGSVYNGGNQLTLGAGNLIVAGAITTNGGSTTTIGAGSFVVGKDNSGYSINDSGTAPITFGDGNFSGTGGLYLSGGGSNVTFGAGNITLGTSNSNGAIFVGGSANLIMGAGDLNANGAISSYGGSNVVFGAGNHYINGTVNLASQATLGAGRYTINGNFLKSSYSTGTANGVTIIASGYFQTDGSASMTLTAPTADNSGNGAMGGIAFASKTTLPSTISGSSANTLGGIFYIPNSDLTVSGAGSVAGSVCYALIVKTIDITGSGQTRDTNCNAPTLSSSTSVALIQ